MRLCRILFSPLVFASHSCASLGRNLDGHHLEGPLVRCFFFYQDSQHQCSDVSVVLALLFVGLLVSETPLGLNWHCMQMLLTHRVRKEHWHVLYTVLRPLPLATPCASLSHACSLHQPQLSVTTKYTRAPALRLPACLLFAATPAEPRPITEGAHCVQQQTQRQDPSRHLCPQAHLPVSSHSATRTRCLANASSLTSLTALPNMRLYGLATVLLGQTCLCHTCTGSATVRMPRA